MKTRNGFVSNSSSSSFVLIGEKVDLQNIKPENLEDNLYMTSTGIAYEGNIWARIDGPEILEFLQNSVENENLNLGSTYLVYHVSYDGENEIDVTKLPKKKLSVVCEEVDQHEARNDYFEHLKEDY